MESDVIKSSCSEIAARVCANQKTRATIKFLINVLRIRVFAKPNWLSTKHHAGGSSNNKKHIFKGRLHSLPCGFS